MGAAMLHIVLAELVLLATQCVGYTIQDKYDAAEFLQRFGYLERNARNESNLALVDLRDPLKEFQVMVGVKPTGILDEETIIFMNKPRCGNVDKVHAQSLHTRSLKMRFKVKNDQVIWSTEEITYRVNRLSRKVDTVSIHKDIDSAFKLWQDNANLIFKRVTDVNQPVDMSIDFFVLDHNDSSPFDGPGRTLAHAFLPGPDIGGDIHFDDAEEWTTESNMGHNLHYAAVHEIGHALGLFHSNERNSIMFPHYQSYNPNLSLHSSDVAQIQNLYGSKESIQESATGSMATTKQVPTVSSVLPQARDRFKQSKSSGLPQPSGGFSPKATPTTSPPFVKHHHKDLCHDTHTDAITTINNGNIYAFKGEIAYLLDSEGGGVISRARIDQLFRGLHPGIDAALTRADGETLFFKADKYWKFDGYSPVAGYPKEIFRHFPEIPNGIDAVFEHPRYGALYFFKGDSLWIFNAKTRKHLKHRLRSQKVPLYVAGIQENSIDSAFVAPNGQIFLFRKNLYWRLDDQSLFTVAKAEPPYPRKTTLIWLNCDKLKSEGTTSL